MVCRARYRDAGPTGRNEKLRGFSNAGAQFSLLEHLQEAAGSSPVKTPDRRAVSRMPPFIFYLQVRDWRTNSEF